MESLAYLARQPILDREGHIYAYELLFRDSPSSNTAIFASDQSATAQILEHILSDSGLSQLIGKNKAFINCSKDMLLDNMFKLLNPKYFVLEILEDVIVDDALIKAVENYKRQGFEIALDDFIFNEKFIAQFEPLFPFTTYVKMDVIDNGDINMIKAVNFFKEKGIKILAEKVETASVYKSCWNAGYDYFQGFYFAKPELVTTKKVDDISEAVLRLLFLLRKHPSLEELSMGFNLHPSLVQYFLKFVNSKAGYVSKMIDNISEAIAWVGMRHIQEWLTLILYARPEFGSTPQKSALYQNATHRAKFMELTTRFVGGSDGDLPAKAYLVGLVSRMDALVGIPIESILIDSEADDDIRSALLQHKGLIGTLLLLADAVEQDNQNTIAHILQELKMSAALLNRCVYDAYSWSHER